MLHQKKRYRQADPAAGSLVDLDTLNAVSPVVELGGGGGAATETLEARVAAEFRVYAANPLDPEARVHLGKSGEIGGILFKSLRLCTTSSTAAVTIGLPTPSVDDGLAATDVGNTFLPYHYVVVVYVIGISQHYIPSPASFVGRDSEDWSEPFCKRDTRCVLHKYPRGQVRERKTTWCPIQGDTCIERRILQWLKE